MDTLKDTSSVNLFCDFCRNSLKAGDIDPAIPYMNYIIDRLELNEEQVLWMCFLYGVTYQLPSAMLIWNEYPDLELVDIPRLTLWWNDNQTLIPFQVDKMKQRKDFVATVDSYKQLVGGSQKRYFDKLLSSKSPQENFDKLWAPLKGIAYFGRFSIWNWCQALKHIAKYNIEPTTLMIGEPDSTSFTDGLAHAFGMPEKATQKVVSNGKKSKVYYKWSDEEKQVMEKLCAMLKKPLNLDNFQIETLACAFKKIWRSNNSRYVGYYNDRMADDIRKTAVHWPGVDWQLLWDARDACIPKEYIHNNLGVDTDKFKLPPADKVYV